MKKSLVIALAALAGIGCAASAQAHVSWSVGIGGPVVGAVVSNGPVYRRAPVYAPAPVVYAAPAYAPVYAPAYAPAYSPVYAPVYAAPPVVYRSAPAYYPRGYIRPAAVFYGYRHGWGGPPVRHYHGGY